MQAILVGKTEPITVLVVEEDSETRRSPQPLLEVVSNLLAPPLIAGKGLKGHCDVEGANWSGRFMRSFA